MSVTLSRRVALVGAAGLLGREIKDQLAKAGVPGSDIALLDLQDEIGLVTDYGDEARVILDAATEPLRSYGLVVFCDDAEIAERFGPVVVAAGGTVADCTGRLPADAIWRGDNVAAPAVLTVPHAGTSLLAGLSRALPLQGAVATLMLPASAGAAHGPDRLAQQSIALLSLGGGNQDDEGDRRTAFDLWPDAGATRRIAAELDRSGVPTPRLLALQAPVFHGLSAGVWLPRASVRQVIAALRDAGIAVADEDDAEAVDSPARVAGEAGVHVAGVRDDAAGGVWVWALMDNHVATAAAVVEIVAMYRTVDGETHN